MGALSEVWERTVTEVEEVSPGSLAGSCEEEMAKDGERCLELRVGGWGSSPANRWWWSQISFSFFENIIYSYRELGPAEGVVAIAVTA
jgi:hypothetical protein